MTYVIESIYENDVKDLNHGYPGMVLKCESRKAKQGEPLGFLASDKKTRVKLCYFMIEASDVCGMKTVDITCIPVYSGLRAVAFIQWYIWEKFPVVAEGESQSIYLTAICEANGHRDRATIEKIVEPLKHIGFQVSVIVGMYGGFGFASPGVMLSREYEKPKQSLIQWFRTRLSQFRF